MQVATIRLCHQHTLYSKKGALFQTLHANSNRISFCAVWNGQRKCHKRWPNPNWIMENDKCSAIIWTEICTIPNRY